VKVQSTTGRSLPHSAQLSGRELMITLRAAHSPLRVVLPTGTLKIGGSARPKVSVVVVDLSGEQTTLPPRTL
jgi:hypothetical protein